MTLRESLADWSDWDVAAFALGVSIGLFSEWTNGPLPHKGIFWSANPIGDALHEALNALVRGGVLERREEPDVQYRWRAGVDVNVRGRLL